MKTMRLRIRNTAHGILLIFDDAHDDNCGRRTQGLNTEGSEGFSSALFSFDPTDHEPGNFRSSYTFDPRERGARLAPRPLLSCVSGKLPGSLSHRLRLIGAGGELSIMATKAKSRRKSARRNPELPPVGSEVVISHEVYFLIAFDGDGMPYIYSAESELSELSTGNLTGGDDKFTIKANISLPFPRLPRYVEQIAAIVAKGGAA